MNVRDGLIVLVIVALGFGIFFMNKPTDSVKPKEENQTLVRAAVGDMASDFSLSNLKGEQVTLSSLKGKPVFITFWTTWCSYCRKELPEVEKLYKAYGEKIEFLMVNVTKRDDKDKVVSFAKEKDYTFPILLDSDGKVSREYDVRGLPSSFLISDTGNIFWKKTGAAGKEELKEALENSLKQS